MAQRHVSVILTIKTNSNYSAATANSNLGNSNAWFPSVFQNETSDGAGVLDIAALDPKLGSDALRAITSPSAVDWWAFGLPDGTNFGNPCRDPCLRPDYDDS